MTRQPELNTPNPKLISTLNVLTWIVYIGLLVEAGTYLFKYIWVVLSPGTENLQDYSNNNINFPDLYQFSFAHYTVVVFFMILITAVKAHAALQVTDLLNRKTMAAPFTPQSVRILMRICYTLCAVGVIALLHNLHNNWLWAQGLHRQGWDDGGWLFAAGVVYIIASIFKRGIALQTENDLTV